MRARTRNIVGRFLAVSVSVGLLTPAVAVGQSTNASSQQASVSASAQPAASSVATVSQNACVSYTYDANGNRITQANSQVSVSPAWGSVSFPCFVWKPQ